MTPDVMVWLQETLGAAPQEAQGTPAEVYAPATLPNGLIASLDTKLAAMTGLARAAYLADCQYSEGNRNHVLAFVDAKDAAKPAMAAAISEALTFSGLEAASLDVLFLRASDAICARTLRALRSVGAEKVYVSNLGNRAAHRRLRVVLQRV